MSELYGKYLAFLSHNSEDKVLVEKIGQMLESRGVRVWFDAWDIRPGDDFVDEINKAISAASAGLIFIGPAGSGPWHKEEAKLIISNTVESKLRLIPILLPGAPDRKNVDMPPNIQLRHMVQFPTVDDEDALESLVFGVTGVSNIRQRIRNKSSDDRISVRNCDELTQSTEIIASKLNRSDITFFVGRSAYSGAFNSLASTTTELSRHLLEKLDIIDATYDKLLPPAEVAAQYFLIQKDGDDLLLEDEIIDLIDNHSMDIPSFYKTLVKFLSIEQPQNRRIRNQLRHKLILTSNLDVNLERALLLSGHSFARIVYHRRATSLFVNEYKKVVLLDNNRVEIDGKIQSLSDLDGIDNLIKDHGKWEKDRFPESLRNLSLNDMPSIILLKTQGSQDIPDSLVLSIDCHYEFLRRERKYQSFPDQIREIIENTQVVMLGTTITDSDFLLANSYLYESLKVSKSRIIVQSPPISNDDPIRIIWNKLKAFTQERFHFDTIESQPEEFLEKLLKVVESQRTD